MEMGYIIDGAFALGILALVWKMNATNEKKTGNIFKRFDQHKEHVDKTYVRKDMCQVLNERLFDTIEEVKQDVKTLLRKNGFKGQ